MKRERILVLGGTQFIGRHLVEQFLNLNYDVTLFNRQKTHPNLFPNTPKIKGDRETNDIQKLKDTKWDYLVDLSCYYPESLQNILNVASDNIKKYILISSCSAYDNDQYRSILKNESTPILSCSDEQFYDQTPMSYGARKAECERILSNSGCNYVILRPALVVGPYDHTDRFYYWIYQVKNNDPLLLPNYGCNRFSITYVKDLVDAIISGMKLDINQEVFNIITLPQTSILDIVKTASFQLNKKPAHLNAEAHFLAKNNIDQWVDMPLWIHGDHFTYSNLKMKNELNISGVSLNNIISETTDYFQKKNWPTPGYGIHEEKRNSLVSVLTDTNN